MLSQEQIQKNVHFLSLVTGSPKNAWKCYSLPFNDRPTDKPTEQSTNIGPTDKPTRRAQKSVHKEITLPIKKYLGIIDSRIKPSRAAFEAGVPSFKVLGTALKYTNKMKAR